MALALRLASLDLMLLKLDDFEVLRHVPKIVVKSPNCRKVSLLASIKSHSAAVIRLPGGEPLLTLRSANLLTPWLDLLTLPIGKFPAQLRNLQ